MTGAGYISRNRYRFPELGQQQREANDQARAWVNTELRRAIIWTMVDEFRARQNERRESWLGWNRP